MGASEFQVAALDVRTEVREERVEEPMNTTDANMVQGNAPVVEAIREGKYHVVENSAAYLGKDASDGIVVMLTQPNSKYFTVMTSAIRLGSRAPRIEISGRAPEPQDCKALAQTLRDLEMTAQDRIVAYRQAGINVPATVSPMYPPRDVRTTLNFLNDRLTADRADLMLITSKIPQNVALRDAWNPQGEISAMTEHHGNEGTYAITLPSGVVAEINRPAEFGEAAAGIRTAFTIKVEVSSHGHADRVVFVPMDYIPSARDVARISEGIALLDCANRPMPNWLAKGAPTPTNILSVLNDAITKPPVQHGALSPQHAHGVDVADNQPTPGNIPGKSNQPTIQKV